MTETTTELAAVRVPTPAELETAYGAILDGKPIPFGDPEIVSRAIAARIMDADTFEDAFVPQEVDAWREAALDVPVRVETFHLNPSTKGEGEGGGSSVYAVAELERLTDGEHLTVTCGGRNVLMQLVKMFEKGWQDRPVKLTAKQTREGFQALWLESA